MVKVFEKGQNIIKAKINWSDDIVAKNICNYMLAPQTHVDRFSTHRVSISLQRHSELGARPNRPYSEVSLVYVFIY